MSLNLKGIRAFASSVIVAAVSLTPPFALAGTGDLDPSFADHGRLNPIPRGSGDARSVVLTEAGGILVGGGSVYTYRDSWSGRPSCQVWTGNYVRRLGADGRVDKSYRLADIPSMEAFDLARQADGSVIAVGRRITGHTVLCEVFSELAVYRLGTDGLLDTGFGLNGFFQWADVGDSQARALVLEPDGRIVVAGVGHQAVDGEQQSRLVVLRLLANGELDATFGDRGFYIGPQVDYLNPIRIVRTEAGGFRVSANGARDCAIVGLTSAGGPDAGFGVAGFAAVESQDGIPVLCESLALLPKDRLLVAGSGPKRVFVSRLRANGTRDPSFAPDPAIAESMSHATAIAPGGENTLLIAGVSLEGASIMRLLSSGERDLQFGDAGRTWIDLPGEHLVVPWIRDMAVQRDRSVIAVGGSPWEGPFVVRLLGRHGGAAPGVVGFSEDFRRPTESEGRAVFRVRRRGGSDGAVSVKYRTNADSEATSGQDFSARSGTLQWADGDTSERRIVMQVLPDRTTEAPESFRVLLRDAQGGVGVGTRAATVEIQADGAPAGQLMFSDVPSIPEESGVGQFWLGRDYHFDGRVCVTMTARPATARAGEDFDAGASTVCWEDQDYEGKLIEIEVVDDGIREGDETFTVELSNPTGGALIGGPRSYVITILDND